MFNKKKKTMYVPDEEILVYNRSQQEPEKSKPVETNIDSELENVEPNIETSSVTDSVTETVQDEKIIENAVTENIANASDNEEIEELSISEDNTAEDMPEDSTIEKDLTSEEDVCQIENSAETETSDKIKPNFFKRITKRFIPMKGDNRKIIINKCVAIVAAIALICSLTYIGFYFGDVSAQDGKLDNIRNNYTLNKDNYEKNEDNQFSKFDVLKAQNSDIAGWINIPNTEVNNPFYHTDNNDFYVTHDMDKQSNSYGALFLDYRCSIDPKSLTQNNIIYGHNMRFGAMFGTLDEYRSIDFYRNNPRIYVDSLYERRVYKIFAIMIVNETEDNTFGYSYSPYRSLFTSETDFMEWIEYGRQRSLYDIPVDIKNQDEIITLSTCCYDYDNARFVILGRLVRDGEIEDVDTGAAVANSDVIYSKEYYDKKGLAVPSLPSSTDTSK